jgi:hypothetical protein
MKCQVESLLEEAATRGENIEAAAINAYEIALPVKVFVATLSGFMDRELVNEITLQWFVNVYAREFFVQ